MGDIHGCVCVSCFYWMGLKTNFGTQNGEGIRKNRIEPETSLSLSLSLIVDTTSFFTSDGHPNETRSFMYSRALTTITTIQQQPTTERAKMRAVWIKYFFFVRLLFSSFFDVYNKVGQIGGRMRNEKTNNKFTWRLHIYRLYYTQNVYRYLFL